MASQVLSGPGPSVSYTNNTGQNVRIVINYMASPTSMSWEGRGGTATVSPRQVLAIGRNLAFNSGGAVSSGGVSISANNLATTEGGAQFTEILNQALPTELMLSAGRTFSATCESYNIVVIPENG